MDFVLTRDVKAPSRGTLLSAGIDFFIPNDYSGKRIVQPGKSVLIPSGVVAKLPSNTALIAFNKSSVSVNKCLFVGACVVDEDYQGEIHLHLVNYSKQPVEINPGEKITQFIVVPIYRPMLIQHDTTENLFACASERGAGGFGSTGTK